MRTKLRDLAVRQAGAGCYSQAALSSNGSKTLYVLFYIAQTGNWLQVLFALSSFPPLSQEPLPPPMLSGILLPAHLLAVICSFLPPCPSIPFLKCWRAIAVQVPPAPCTAIFELTEERESGNNVHFLS